MTSVSSPQMSFDESLYAKLPQTVKNQLAEATGKQSAVSSATALYRILGNPSLIKDLPNDQFQSSKNSSGQIKWATRMRLAIRHFFYALFSRFDQLGKDFATLVQKHTNPEKSTTTSRENSKISEQSQSIQAKTPAQENSNTFQDTKEMASGMIIGDNIGDGIDEWSKSRKKDQSDSKDPLSEGMNTLLEEADTSIFAAFQTKNQGKDRKVGEDKQKVSTNGDSKDVGEKHTETQPVHDPEETDSIGQTADDAEITETDAPTTKDIDAGNTLMAGDPDPGINGDIGDMDTGDNANGFFDALKDLGKSFLKNFTDNDD